MKQVQQHLVKYWLAWLIGAILVIVIYSVYRWRQPPKIMPDVPKPLDRDKMLSKGNASPEVGELQKMMNELNIARSIGMNTLSTDNDFGTLTETALEYYTGGLTTTLNQFQLWIDSNVPPFWAGSEGGT